ncbi:SDR family NAD(P)-dependent oxidoreductase [Actinomadura rudentiformis]|uniref:SDR family oxidoreductase n=1 Tax=Actinomadura rudentiformis TaxID=359158 RepID=A0A6H9Y765_9ACTN|nr:SDR family NAD(P)-dependent oxidoreductase [Actinomadura rudentiformis]KAB2340374.1 SDR family oxidoreductase [Actinomadura rudentiformis]
MQLQGQVAVITGGTRGIGFGIARAFAAEGAKVVMGGRSEDKGKQALDELDAGDGAAFQRCDVRVREQVEDLVDFAARTYGRLDIMVNNAGGSDGFALVHELGDEAWDNALALNLNATFWGTRRALRHMVAASHGRIINISSVEGKQATKAAVSHYITNKHAINGFTKAVAFEYGPMGITSNAICPGAVETDLMKDAGPVAAEAQGITYEQFLDGYAQESMIKKLNTVEQVAAMAVLLAGENGAGITGTLVNVDGGTAAW